MKILEMAKKGVATEKVRHVSEEEDIEAHQLLRDICLVSNSNVVYVPF